MSFTLFVMLMSRVLLKFYETACSCDQRFCKSCKTEIMFTEKHVDLVWSKLFLSLRGFLEMLALFEAPSG